MLMGEATQVISDAPATLAHRVVAAADPPPVPRRRPVPAPKPWAVDLLAAAAAFGFGAVLATVFLGESRATLAAPGGLLSAAGRLTGLIVAHVVLITLGYAAAAQSGVPHEIWVLITSYQDMFAAFAGFGLLIMASVSSYRAVRLKLKYETWWVIHLYLHLAAGRAAARGDRLAAQGAAQRQDAAAGRARHRRTRCLRLRARGVQLGDRRCGPAPRRHFGADPSPRPSDSRDLAGNSVLNADLGRLTQ